MTAYIPHRRKAFQPSGSPYVGVQPDIGIIINENTGTAVSPTLPEGGSDLTADFASWITGPPIQYDCDGQYAIFSGDGDYASILDSVTDQLTLFVRAEHVGVWNFAQRWLMNYGEGLGAGLSFGMHVDRNHTSGNYRIGFYSKIGGSTTNVMAQVDLGASAQTGEHSVAAVYNGTDVQFYLDGSTHGSAQSLSGNIDLPTVEVVALGCVNTSGGGGNYWDDGIRDARISLSELSSTEISEWHDNPVT